MTLLILLAGTGTASAPDIEGDVALRDYTIYAAGLRDYTIYTATLTDSTIYRVTLTDREST